MLKKLLPLAVLVACLALFAAPAQGATTATTVTITGTVDTFAEWDSATQTIAAGDFDGHITAVNQTRTASKTFALYMNGNVTITAAGGVNAGVLKDVSTSTYSLTTQYKLTGDLDSPDAAYKAADAAAGGFFNAGNSYAITHVAGTGSYDVTLSVQMTSPAASAPEADDYSCTVVLTATF